MTLASLRTPYTISGTYIPYAATGIAGGIGAQPQDRVWEYRRCRLAVVRVSIGVWRRAVVMAQGGSESEYGTTA
eukprot:421274-Rhodomonas_salina.1